MKGVTCLSKDDTTAVLRVTRQGIREAYMTL